LAFVVKCVGYDVEQDKGRTPEFAAPRKPQNNNICYNDQKSFRQEKERLWMDIH